MVTAYDAKTGNEVYVQERAAGERPVLRLAGGGQRAHLLHVPGRRHRDGPEGRGDKPEVVAKNPKLGERVAATPAIADDTLYVRTAGHLYAFAATK